MRGDLDYPYEPLAATDTPFAASLGDHAPNFNGVYGSSGSSHLDERRSQWGEDGVDRSPRAESPLPPSASGPRSPNNEKPPPERSLLKPGSRKPAHRGHLHQRESRARYASTVYQCWASLNAAHAVVRSSQQLFASAGRPHGSSSMKLV